MDGDGRDNDVLRMQERKGFHEKRECIPENRFNREMFHGAQGFFVFFHHP
jgi:hypothetical protein